MKLDDVSSQVYLVAQNEARLQNHEYVTPEHFLYAALMFDLGKAILRRSGGDLPAIHQDLSAFFQTYFPWKTPEAPAESFEYIRLFELAKAQASSSGRQILPLGNILASFFQLQESVACYILQKNGVNKLRLLRCISHELEEPEKPERPARPADIPERIWPGEKKLPDGEFLRTYAVNLTEKAKKGLFDPLIGREDILQRTLQVLGRRLKNNPVHVGDPGVGKTALVEGLAQRVAAGAVPGALKGAQIFHVDIGTLVAGTRYRGDFEERLLRLLDLIARQKKAIVYLDEIHTAVGTGAVSGGGMDATSLLKPYLTGGRLRFIGATTHEEYKKYIEKDRALSRRFEKIEVNEPTEAECVEILKGLAPQYEAHHNVEYPEEIVRLICELSVKYLHDRFLPDKAIDVMDETGAYVRLQEGEGGRRPVTVQEVERTVAFMARVPQQTVSAGEADKLRHLQAALGEQVFGQEEALQAVAEAIKASRSGLNDGERPVASLLFVGPTGVGKTEVARQLAALLGVALCRFDMSEYQEKHSVARLIGAPPGYVGYEEGGLLTDQIRRTPHCVLLLDEIEKAHGDIYNLLLQLMDYGRLTDTAGKKADFTNVVLIMTSNAGAKDMHRRVIGFEGGPLRADAVFKEVERIFSPEFRNRLDKVVLFNGVDEAMALSVAKKALGRLSQRLAPKNIRVDATEEAYRFMAAKGFSREFGAREIIRLVEQDLKRQLVDEVLFGALKDGGLATVTLAEGALRVETAPPVP